MKRKRTATSKRLRRSAGAYKRLAQKRGLPWATFDHYMRTAERLERQAEHEERRA